MGFKWFKKYRLSAHDYSSDGFYFVTICTKDRGEFFGEIRNGIMGLNEMGCIAAKFWQEIPVHFSNAKLDTWQIMPNHLHGVICLDNGKPGKRFNINPPRRNAINRVPTGWIINNPMQMEQTTLGKIIRWFKGKTTYFIRNNLNQNFAWQSRYHDRIIRNEEELWRIREYIECNPYNWKTDRNNKMDLWL